MILIIMVLATGVVDGRCRMKQKRVYDIDTQNLIRGRHAPSRLFLCVHSYRSFTYEVWKLYGSEARCLKMFEVSPAVMSIQS